MPEETEITCEYCDEPLSNLGSAFEGPNGSVICPKVQTFHAPKKPEPGSTRPEMPPAFAMDAAQVIMGAVSLHMETGTIAMPSVEVVAKAIAKAANDEWERLNVVPAASVQQEPARSSPDNCRPCNFGEHWNCLGKPCVCEENHHPAAPRTQGRPKWLIEEIIRDVAELPDRSSPDDWPEAMLVTGEELQIILERYEPLDFCASPCGHSSQYAYTENGGKNIVCLLCERAQARTQPAPKCPKCGSERIGIELSQRAGCVNVIACPDCKMKWSCSGLFELGQFFTALPEATKEEK